MSNKKPKILWYDLETSPLQAWVWGCGKQYVGHKQLVKQMSRYGIICVTYCWNDGKSAKSIDWGYEEQNTAKLVAEFDQIIKQADVVIGKNSDRFDNKMLNAQRMLHGLPGMPAWTKYTDDLEKQMRKHFRLPSHALDYISAQLGYGGKIKMEFQDWIDIVEKNPNGKKAFDKMIKYGKKDVADTRALWLQLEEHFEPKFNVGLWKHKGNYIACKRCGSTAVKRNGYDIPKSTGLARYCEFTCLSCGKYAGRIALDRDDQIRGKMK